MRVDEAWHYNAPARLNHRSLSRNVASRPRVRNPIALDEQHSPVDYGELVQFRPDAWPSRTRQSH
jgi:hypothetical protein